ncbi:MAG: hypothetical protein A2X83_01330 [Desulfuromonadales bacterium GWD2_54_10]|nr:MAG: hypothetical protein A2X83_01330 [Desulfuromonadales bacterium GWD2_54_10]
MAFKVLKPVTMTILNQKHIRKDWFIDFDGETFQRFFDEMSKDMKKQGIALKKIHNRDVVIKIKSYADLLNVVKLSSPEVNHSNQCIGHIIGKSEHLDIMEDIRAAVNKLAFAPETIAPDSEFRKVCHNCGCGC